MKNFLLVILAPAALLAQTSQPIPIRVQPGPTQIADSLPDNYQVTLAITDKEEPAMEISVVVASTRFSTTVGEQSLTFSGTLTLDDSGSVLVAYALGWETPLPTKEGGIQFKSSSTQGSVRLRLGEDLQIIRAGSRTARLTIKKLEAGKPK